MCKTLVSCDFLFVYPFLPWVPGDVAAPPQCSPGSSLSVSSFFAVFSPFSADGDRPHRHEASHDPVLSEVDMFPSCFVCDGHFTSSGPLSRCVLQCCPISIHLQCVTNLVHLPSHSVVCPACNSQSPSSLDFLHFQHLCCSPRGGSCRRVHDLFLSCSNAWLGQPRLR